VSASTGAAGRNAGVGRIPLDMAGAAEVQTLSFGDSQLDDVVRDPRGLARTVPVRLADCRSDAPPPASTGLAALTLGILAIFCFKPGMLWTWRHHPARQELFSSASAFYDGARRKWGIASLNTVPRRRACATGDRYDEELKLKS